MRSLQCVICSAQSAVRTAQSTLCNISFAVCSAEFCRAQSAVRTAQSVVRNILFAACSAQFAVRNLPCSICLVLSAMRRLYCAECGHNLLCRAKPAMHNLQCAIFMRSLPYASALRNLQWTYGTPTKPGHSVTGSFLTGRFVTIRYVTGRFVGVPNILYFRVLC